MNKSYNYTIVDNFRKKIYIPYINIEFQGVLTPILLLLLTICITLILGTLMSYVMSSTGYLIAFIISLLIDIIIHGMLQITDKNKNKNALKSFYYIHIKKNRYIITSTGAKKYLSARKEGIYYYDI